MTVVPGTCTHRLLATLGTALALLVSSPLGASSGVGSPAFAADGVRVSLIPGESEARFRAQEQLFGRSLPNEAVGVTRDVTGEIVLAADGAPIAEQSRIVVDLRSLRSDESRRDNYIKANTLETNIYPTADFVPVAAPGLPWPLPPGGEVGFQLVGDLTVHGVTQPVTWDASAAFTDGQVAGRAATRVRMTDFGMTPPKAGPVVSIEDELTLELDFRGSLGPAFAGRPLDRWAFGRPWILRSAQDGR